ncbi:MAG: AraC family transcriptional regulator ligand-binding domain-containing protein [Myxococcota bacterium]
MPPHGYSLGPGWKGLLAQLGICHEDVLRRAQLPEDLLNSDEPRVPAEQFFAFSTALEQSFDDASLPLLLVEAMSPEFFSPPVFAALCSPSLEIAAERLSRFKPLIGPVDLHVERDESGLTLEYHWHETAIPPPASLSGSEILFIVKLARMGTRFEIKPTRVHLPALPPDHEAYEKWLGVRIQVAPSLSVQFSAEDATRPFLSANGSMWTIFEPELRRRLADLEHSATVEERTRAVLLEALPSGQVSLDNVARRLATSSRSLQRKLREEGTSFKAVVRGTRERLANHYLSRTPLSTTEIAFLLGFEDATSFFRAFHSWTGSTPDRVRRAQH